MSRGDVFSGLLARLAALGFDAQGRTDEGQVSSRSLWEGGNSYLNLVSLDGLDGGSTYLVGSGGAHTRWWLGAGIGEHSCSSNEAWGDEGCPHAFRIQVSSQAQGEAAEAELRGVVDRGPWAGGLA